MAEKLQITNSELFLDYELPNDRIAQRPIEPRDHARLLVVRRKDNSLEHRLVYDLPRLLDPGDLLVVNDTRVMPARLIGKRSKTGGYWEGLYLGTTSNGEWQLLSQTRGHLVVGEQIEVEPGPLKLTLLDRPTGQPWLYAPDLPGSTVELLKSHGHTPLPPYIRKGRADEADRTQYQTVFAQMEGSVAAPTAGLHFTPELFERLRKRGIGRASVTLHVGLGTFQPLNDGKPEKHIMHREWCSVPAKTVEAINKTKKKGGRVVAVGTTTVRTLESAVRASMLQSWTGETDLFIRPPYEFRIVDALMTNFHLPRTTLLLLVDAFAGSDLVRRAYEAAMENDYRFFSYGDAMLVL
jgi:S-adenosylmethionine:tRNA ribosyltransferase-isomerase